MYRLYLHSVLFPVAPSKINTKIKNKNKTYDLLNLGEVNFLKKQGLTEFSFDLLLPSRNYPFALYEGGFKDPAFYLGLLEKLKVDQKPFRLIISRLSSSEALLFDTNLEVSLEDYDIIEATENGEDVLVAINLKQYKPFATQVQELKIASTSSSSNSVKVIASASPRPTKEPTKTYIVKSGDNLWIICKRELGDGSLYPSVAKLNGIKNPNLIYPGQVLRLG